MASRLLNARRVRMRASAGKRTPLRPFAPVGSSGGEDNKPKFSALPVGTSQNNDRRATRDRPNGQSSFVDQKGNIVTIAIVPAGSPARRPNPSQQRSAVRRHAPHPLIFDDCYAATFIHSRPAAARPHPEPPTECTCMQVATGGDSRHRVEPLMQYAMQIEQLSEKGPGRDGGQPVHHHHVADA